MSSRGIYIKKHFLNTLSYKQRLDYRAVLKGLRTSAQPAAATGSGPRGPEPWDSGAASGAVQTSQHQTTRTGHRRRPSKLTTERRPPRLPQSHTSCPPPRDRVPVTPQAQSRAAPSLAWTEAAYPSLWKTATCFTGHLCRTSLQILLTSFSAIGMYASYSKLMTFFPSKLFLVVPRKQKAIEIRFLLIIERMVIFFNYFFTDFSERERRLEGGREKH